MGDPSANVFTPRVGCCNYSKAPQCLPVLLVCQAVISQHCSASCGQACYSTPWRLVLHFVSSNLHYSVQTCMTDTFLIMVILFLVPLGIGCLNNNLENSCTVSTKGLQCFLLAGTLPIKCQGSGKAPSQPLAYTQKWQR